MSRQHRNQTSRPKRLAEYHLALLKHIKECRQRGEEVDFKKDESLRKILREQSGAHVHHTAHKRIDCDKNDPLRDILPESAVCGGGTDMSVFRIDNMHWAVRLWPEIYLSRIMDAIDDMERTWRNLSPSVLPTTTNSKEALDRLARDEEEAIVASLLDPSGSGGRSTIHYGDARPLY